MRVQDGRRTEPRTSLAAADDTETAKSPRRSCSGGPASLDHSIDPIVPHARTAAKKTARQVLVCFMGRPPWLELNHALQVFEPLIHINQPVWLAWNRLGRFRLRDYLWTFW